MTGASTHSHVAVVGTGFAGVAAVVRLKQAGFHDVVVFERGTDVGGTWRDNTYPGCQCDVPSHLYSLSFAPNPDWSRTYSMQPEIAAYLRRTAEQFDVLPHVRFGTPVEQARWDAAEQHWVLDTPAGVHTADVVVMANGPMSSPKVPTLPGIDRFEGATFHSAQWDHGHDLAGERVAVVGTGASAIQFVPAIQPEVERLVVFQRTPPWVLPHRDRAITRWERALYRRVPVAQRVVRACVYWSRELVTPAFTRRPKGMRVVRRIALAHLRRQVPDPALRAKLTPTYTPGCKRLLLSNHWYPALSAPNVSVETSGIREVRARSIVTHDGTEHEVDTIVFGTGFHVTDNPVFEHVLGADGRSLADVWRETGMRAYKGTTVSGFPNLFFLAGPNTGIGNTSLLVMVEAQVGYVVDALRTLRSHGAAAVDVLPERLESFNRGLQRRMPPTVWSSGGCSSWYLDAHGRNPTMWPDFTFAFVRMTRRFDVGAYRLSAPTTSSNGSSSRSPDRRSLRSTTPRERPFAPTTS
ncbi:MAG: NAD(P)/FAD-dependent oxidoreductase [Actinomycetota bacterium]|nr:NAD(P)/FAD-dependent oxidoreductase [Actinomycetota bacterium]